MVKDSVTDRLRSTLDKNFSTTAFGSPFTFSPNTDNIKDIST